MSTPLPPVHNVVKAVLRHTIGDDANVENVLHVGYTSTFAPLTQADCDAMAQQIGDTWNARVISLLASNVTFDDVTVTDLDLATGNQSVRAYGTSGGLGSTAINASTALCVQLRTSTRGRSYRGRAYIAGGDEGNRAAPQQWTSSFAENMEDSFELMNSDLAGGGAPQPLGFVIVSYFSGTDKTIPGKRPVPIRRAVPIATVTTHFIGNTRFASQRRRNA